MKNILICLFLFLISRSTVAQDQLRDFKASTQKLALLGLFNEFVEPSVEEALVKDLNKLLARYTRTYGPSSVAGFRFLSNPNNQYFKTADQNLDETQKEYLQKVGEDNQVDLLAFGVVRESVEGVELELQIYDTRIQTLSGIERESFPVNRRDKPLEAIVYRTMNYLDREGFVHPSPQDFLQKPVFLQSNQEKSAFSDTEEDFFLTPADLGGQPLAGRVSIGGEKTPFWEKWWFWGVVLGGIASAGGMSYYFLVLDQPTTGADIAFKAPATQ